MKTLNIITAVLAAIKSFGNDTFSVWNLTSKIRDDVNTQKYELTNTGRTVYHDAVKEAFLELVDGGILDEYSLKYNPQGYYEYRLTASVNDTATPVVATLPDVKNISATSVFPKDVQVKMYTYLKNNGEVTMKQIQSRLKGFSCTCRDIKDFLAKLNLIDPKTTSLPDSLVKTVNINS